MSKIPPAIQYTVLRLALFAGVLGVLWLLGARGLLALGLAALVSGLLSFTLLAKQRSAMSESLVRRVQRVKESIDRSAAAEDEAVDALEAARARKPNERK
ncbi:DUF4229 domain-containing protein [Carbonactinospora thermoautotrophica]|uniref:DUF4229 domain-containing protein n=1 Tax=Carbonactinospora thermoautotrophica TaxID=1469144 RepID=UPI00082CFAEE|nr:DUF4229 domain-containing protein [Carbonactinospora thermoautotrophica]